MRSGALAAVGILLINVGEAVPEEPEFRWRQSETSIALMNGGRIVWRHVHDPEQGKPYFHPLATVDGTILTELRPADHRWHRAAWFSWKFINGVNYWEEDPKTGRSQGLTEISKVNVEEKADSSAEIDLRISYHERGKGELLGERRALRISAPDAVGNYTIDWTSVFTAREDVELGRTPIPGEEGGKSFGGYAGLSVRAGMELRHWAFLDSEGRENGSHGKRANWLQFNGGLKGGQEAGITLFDHPANPGYPNLWYANKGMPYFSPALLFEKGVMVKKGETLTLTYRILVQSRIADFAPWPAPSAGSKTTRAP